LEAGSKHTWSISTNQLNPFSFVLRGTADIGVSALDVLPWELLNAFGTDGRYLKDPGKGNGSERRWRWR
jgi:hypothetical protein